MRQNNKNNESTKSAQSEGIRKGRFEGGMDRLFAKFNASISFDKRLYAHDILGSIAHAEMLGAQGIIPKEDAELIKKGLLEVKDDIEQGRLAFREDLEDVHINVEEALKARIGEAAGRLHTARSRNDQVALDLRLFLGAEIDAIKEDLAGLMASLTDKAEENIDVIMPGYTHLQRAQPVRLSHYLMAYCQMFRRDWQRYSDSLKRTAVLPLGSAALAGTTFPIDRAKVAENLGFPKISVNSMDGVSDRDFALEFLFDCSTTMMHLSRLAEELIIWSSSEFSFCSLPDAYCSGSSIMPQKKNPDACELVRGKVGRVYGDLIALLTTLKALPLTYNKDLQEDKEPVFDALDTVRGCVGIMTGMIPGILFNAAGMMEAASDPSLAATDLADRLARQGIPFREAHEIIGGMVRESKTGPGGASIPTPEEMVEARGHLGGTSRESVLTQIRQIRTFLDENKKPGSSCET